MKAAPEDRIERLPGKDRRAATEFANELRRQYNGQVVSVLLFGSRARGEAQPDSDMDILVVMPNADPKTRRAIRYLAVEIWLKHGIYLSTQVWSHAHWRKLEDLQTLLFRNICRDGIRL